MRAIWGIITFVALVLAFVGFTYFIDTHGCLTVSVQDYNGHYIACINGNGILAHIVVRNGNEIVSAYTAKLANLTMTLPKMSSWSMTITYTGDFAKYTVHYVFNGTEPISKKVSSTLTVSNNGIVDLSLAGLGAVPVAIIIALVAAL